MQKTKIKEAQKDLTIALKKHPNDEYYKLFWDFYSQVWHNNYFIKEAYQGMLEKLKTNLKNR